MPYIPEHSLLAKAAAQKLGYSYQDFDEGNGYLFKVSNSHNSLFMATGSVCTYPINSATAVGLARDKTHTNRILNSFGYPTIIGQHFFIRDEYINFRNPGHELIDLWAYTESLGYPLFCKPNNGSRGDFAESIHSHDELVAYLQRVKQKYDTIIVQEYMQGVEYRVFCFDQQAWFSYIKKPHAILGDGIQTAKKLLAQHNQKLSSIGVSNISETLIEKQLKHIGLSLSSVITKGQILVNESRSNINSGGLIENFTGFPNNELCQLALKCAKKMNLRICGVDILDISKQADQSQLVVLEVNGNPSISSLLKIGQDGMAIDIWSKLLVESLS